MSRAVETFVTSALDAPRSSRGSAAFYHVAQRGRVDVHNSGNIRRIVINMSHCSLLLVSSLGRLDPLSAYKPRQIMIQGNRLI